MLIHVIVILVGFLGPYKVKESQLTTLNSYLSWRGELPLFTSGSDHPMVNSLSTRLQKSKSQEPSSQGSLEKNSWCPGLRPLIDSGNGAGA